MQQLKQIVKIKQTSHLHTTPDQGQLNDYALMYCTMGDFIFIHLGLLGSFAATCTCTLYIKELWSIDFIMNV